MRLFFLLMTSLTLTSVLSSQNYNAITFPVTVEGNTMKYPFTGGLHAPQFSQTDFNQDGNMDLFVFDRQGGVPMVFEYDGQGMSSEAYTYRPDYKASFPDSLVNWALFRDYNNDGIGDLFVSPTYGGSSGFQLYEGSFDGNEYAYKIRRMGNVEGRLEILWYLSNNGTWINATTPFTDVPEIIDVDFDGDLDLLAFDLGGSFVQYYKNLQIEEGLTSDTMKFIVADRCFGRFKEAGTNADIFLSPDSISCASRLIGEEDSALLRGGGAHAGSTIMAFDNNNDQALELVIGDLSTETLMYLENGNLSDIDVMVNATNGFPRYDTPVDLPFFVSSFNVDINGDGLKDLISSVNFNGKVLDSDQVSYHINTGSEDQRFQFIQNDFLVQETIDLGSYTSPLFIDENQDGLMDILVASGGYFDDLDQSKAFIALFRNTGTKSQPEFVLEDRDYLNLSLLNLQNFIRPVLTSGDMDSDGDVDLIMGLENGTVVYVQNNGGAGQPCRFGNIVDLGISVGNQASPAIGDINNDGLLDIIIGEQINNFYDNNGQSIQGSIAYFQNIGTRQQFQFETDLNAEPNVNTLGQMSTKLYLDNFETVRSSATIVNTGEQLEFWLGAESGRIKRYGFNSDLRSKFTLIDSIVGKIDVGTRSHLDMYDINNDGYLEILIGNARGGLEMHNTDIFTELISTDDQTAFQSEIQLFPNPTSSIINISTGNLKINNIQLNTVSGKRIKTYNSVQDQINLAGLPAGIYFLVFQTDDNRISKKVVISE